MRVYYNSDEFTPMSPDPQEADIGLSSFLACGAGILSFLICAGMLVFLFLWLGWLEINICIGSPCLATKPTNDWLSYGILLTAGVSAAIAFGKTGDWVLRNSKRKRVIHPPNQM